MIPLEESYKAVDLGDYYIIQPAFNWWNTEQLEKKLQSKQNAMDEVQPFEYASNTNEWWLNADELTYLSIRSRPHDGLRSLAKKVKFMTCSNSILPYGRQNIDEDDIRAVVDALSGQYLTTGPTVDAFEEALGIFLAAGGCASCSNGTTALHLALLQANIGPGDAVLVPSITFLASANAVRYVGAEVVFADVDADTALMTAEHCADAFERAGDKNIRAVMPVHIGGQCVAPMELQAVCETRDVKIIEDATHALGTRYFDSELNTRLENVRIAIWRSFRFILSRLWRWEKVER